MSSVGDGLCAPTHGNVEVWVTSALTQLQVYSNESYSAGAIGYAGLSGLYTTHDFVVDGINASLYDPTFYADFWKDFVDNDALISATQFSVLNASSYFPPSEDGVCDDEVLGCENACSKSAACTAREADGKECLVVAMMYASYDRGYLQAAMSNLNIPAYFCFLGYSGLLNYVLEAQSNAQPVLFYHYEPDMFHQAHPGLFDRVFLPRALPEKVLENTGTYGELGYGNATTNPVAVDFPTNPLGKYAASLLTNYPIASLVSKYTITDLDMNVLLNNYINASADLSLPDPYFSAACKWVKSHYSKWRLWIDRLPLCTYDAHMEYTISGCNDTSGTREIAFRWISPDPTNESLPFVCDGGFTELPAPILTSRSCDWLMTYERSWASWIGSKPECDASFYTYDVSECDSSANRIVTYRWLLPSSTDATESLECSDGTTLPDSVSISCEYVPASSPIVGVVAALAALLMVVLLFALIFVFRNRTAPIIKRSQYELLELMIFGGFFMAGSAIAYAGKPTNFLCGIRPILIAFGFTTTFGALVVKSLRVYRVFMQKAMKRKTVTLRMIAKVVTTFYMIDVTIFVVWFGADFPGPLEQVEQAREFPGEVSKISCHSSSFIFSGLLIFWKAILLFAGLYVSFLIRKVSVDFQESTWIFSSAVVVLFACLVIIPLAYIVDLSAPAFFVFLAGMLLLSTTMVIGLMIIPKILRLNDTETSRTSGVTDTTNGTSNSATSRPRLVSVQATMGKYVVKPTEGRTSS